MSEKSLRNQANHGFLAWAEDPRGRKGALPLERMRKRWRAGHSGVYSFVAGQAKWKSRLNINSGIPRCQVYIALCHIGVGGYEYH